MPATKPKYSAAATKRCVYPFPVYEGQFSDGSTLRMSVWQPLGKPWDFEHCRRLFESLRSKELVSGAMHHAGELILDPMSVTAAKAKRPGAKELRGVIRDLLAEIGKSESVVARRARELV